MSKTVCIDGPRFQGQAEAGLVVSVGAREMRTTHAGLRRGSAVEA